MKQRQISILLIPVFILTVFWVAFNVYHNYVSSTITDPLTHQIIPIQGKFDSQTISEVKNRKRVSPEDGILGNTVSPTPDPVEDIASDSASANQNLEENL